ncbi:MAG: hypothetical protein AB1305_01815 [Candidatus Hadarchaeota archaeon]
MTEHDHKTCPACDKPTGGYVPCPHCGADPRFRVTLKFAMWLCIAALALAAVFIYMSVATSEIAPTPVSTIDTWMDYSYVVIQGVVSSGPQYSETSMTFTVYDGSALEEKDATITVEVYDPAFHRLLADNKVPSVGDNVRIFGQLRAPASGDRQINPSNADEITLTKAQVSQTTVPQILNTFGTSQSLLYNRLTVTGSIKGLRPLSSAKIYTLEDNGREIEVYVHNGLGTYVEKSQLNLKVLDMVRITAGLSHYSGTPQFSIADFDEVQVTGSDNLSSTALENIDNGLVDKYVRTGGKVVFVEMVGTGSDLEVSERIIWLENSAIRISVNEDLFQILPAETKNMVSRGAQLELIGKVKRYGSGLRIEWVGPQTPTISQGQYEPAPVDNFANITSAAADNLVTVAGAVQSTSLIIKGYLPDDIFLNVYDNFGNTTKVYLPNFMYERMQSPPRTGENVKVVGKVMTVSGAVAVQPGVLGDVQKVS